MEPKNWWESKTIRTNVIVMVLAVILYVLQGISDGALQVQIDPAVVALALGVVNIVLRFVTSQPVK
jgi:hypothetical protein